jgi:S1-C subfamily serine protease
VLDHKPGDRVGLTVMRGGEQRTIDVELGTRPDQPVQG